MSTLNPTAIAALTSGRASVLSDALYEAEYIKDSKTRLALQEANFETFMHKYAELGDALGLTPTEQEADWQAARARREADAERGLTSNSVNDDAVQ